MTVYRFEEIAHNINDKKMPVPGDEKTYIGLEHLDTGSLQVTRWGQDVVLTGEKLVMKKGDVLFGRRNTYLRRAAIAPHDGIFSAHGMIFRPKTDVIDADFFPFFIASDYFMDEAIKISVGSLSPTVNWGALKKLEFDIPSMEEQKRLAKILTAAEETRQAYKKLIKQTDELIKAKFTEMFEQQTNGSSNLRKIGELGDVLTGTTPSMKIQEYYDSKDILFIKPSDLSENEITIIKTSENYISEKARKSARIFPKGAVLITCIGTIGKIGIAGLEGSCNQQINVIIPNEHVNSVFLAYSLFMMKNKIQEAANSPVVPILNKTDFSKLTMFLPPIDQQEKFAEFVKQAEQTKLATQQSLDALNETVRALVNRNFN